METNLIIPMGLPGCGKSTWGRTFMGADRMVSTDQIRLDLFKTLVRANAMPGGNDRVFSVFHTSIANSLKHHYSVYADATNLDKNSRLTLIDIAKRTGAKPHLVLFDNLSQARKRNAERDEDSIVPDDVMRRFTHKYILAKAFVHQEGYASITTIGDIS